jgi:hypothetical protein
MPAQHPLDVVVGRVPGPQAMVMAAHDHEGGVGPHLTQGFDQLAVPLQAIHLCNPGGQRTRAHALQHLPALLLGQRAAAMVQLCHLLQQIFLRTQADLASGIKVLRRLGVALQHLQQQQRRGQPLRRPGRAITQRGQGALHIHTRNHLS